LTSSNSDGRNPFDAEVVFDRDPARYVYSAEDPGDESVIPKRTEIEISPCKVEILPSREEKPKLNWVCYEVQGAEVFFLTPEGDVLEEPITERDSLKEGMKVSAWGGVWTVKAHEDGKLYLDSERCSGTLEFGQDMRNCWACTCIINKRLYNPPKKISIVSE
jgi:hypothetical protein